MSNTNPICKEGVDFQFFDYDDDVVGIEILQEPFKGIRYFYQEVSPREVDGSLILDFNFSIISMGDDAKPDIDNQDMRKLMGDILISIVIKDL